MSIGTTALTSVPPQVALLNLTTGHWIMQGIFVAVKLGIADLLRDGPQSSATLAESAAANPRALYLLLRALSSVGIFYEGDDGRFALTPMAECLLTDAPGSMHAWALVMGESYAAQMWSGLLDSVRTGETAFDHVHGIGCFDYFVRHPEQGRLFDAAMTSLSAPEIPGVIAAYDFSEVSTLVEIAGGHGSFLGAILEAYPTMKGVLSDVPSVIDGAHRHLGAARLADRCAVVAIDFFESVPSGGDAYILKHIIHDWNDTRATTILKNCHRAMTRNAKLLLVEMVIPPGNDPEFAKWLDVGMLVLTGGCERTEIEYRDLLSAAGFRITRIVPTRSPVSVIEAVSL